MSNPNGYLATLGVNGIVSSGGSNSMRVELEQNAADDSGIDPQLYFQVVQSAQGQASIKMIREIDFDVSYQKSAISAFFYCEVNMRLCFYFLTLNLGCSLLVAWH